MNKKILIISLFLLIVCFVVYKLYGSLALINNDSMIQENSELTYYIDVIYDGIDSNVITSSDTTTAEVYSDYIYVESKIPEGLTFNRFVTGSDGTVGAVKRSDGTSCAGYVVGDEAGLVYDSTTNIVSFKIKDLQAGCKLTVGIVTIVSSLNDETRKDFYNTAFARENYSSVFSNTLHTYIGESDMVLYSVNYKYTGTVPKEAPSLPSSTNYNNGVTVGVENNVTLEGYTFSGWSSKDVKVVNGKFVMPSSDVVFVGSFSNEKTYQVSYSISGTGPSGYVVPNNKKYSVGDSVTVDSLKDGDVVDGYKFLGWTSVGLDLSDGTFLMPSNNVNIIGKFEKITYTVSYEFKGTVKPNNAVSLLPKSASYSEGDKVKLAAFPNAKGYKFLGWYYEDNFQMPDKDVVIYGSWMALNGEFSPNIKNEIINSKSYYSKGDVVKFKITIKNTADFDINDVMLYSDLKGIIFNKNKDYVVKSNQYVMIPSISANGTVIVNASCKVNNDKLKIYKNTVKIIGALANDYVLDDDKEYKSSVNFIVTNF